MKFIFFIHFLFLYSILSVAQDDFEQYNERPEAIEDNAPEENYEPPREVREEKKEENAITPTKSFGAKSSSRFDKNQEADIFGRETTQSQDKKDKKYVSLNPETAFGPEIISSFDFPDTDIIEITKHMQKLTGINLILDKNVKGKVSISAPTPITVGDAWKAYLVALNMAGFSLVKTGEFYHIINSRDIRYTPTKIYTGDYIPDVENYMMKIIPLKHVDASEIVRNFRPFMSRYGRILDINQTNTIIVTDTGTNINRLLKLVRFLDVAGFEESMQILPVKHTSAQELAKLLDSILKEDRGSSRSRRSSKSSASKSGNTGPNISKIIAEPRSNSIIAMANKAGGDQLRELIRKLDVKTASQGSGKIQVYYLQYGDSEEISKTLTSLISNAQTNKSSSSRRSRFSDANDDEGTIFSEEVKITADKSTNSLVVTASPTDWLTVKQVISKLDIPRDQVYVEGLIVETTVTNGKEFGTNYAGLYGEGIAQKAGFGAQSILGLNDPTKIPDSFFAGFGIGGTETITVGGATIKGSPINAIIKASSRNSKTNILATPQILVMDNTEGVFEVGSKVPITNSISNANGAVGQNNATQDVTMKIKITPQINKVTRFIKLKIDQTISDFTTRDIQVNNPTGGVATDDRNITTEVVVKDRDTIAMGGLLRNKISDVENKVPILGDVPVLGWLFKNTTSTVDKVNMIFFLTPTIISPYEKTASKKTLDVIDQRNKAVRQDSVIEDKHKEKIDELTKKVERQTQGPLFDEEQATLYENSDGPIGAPSSVTIEDVNNNNGGQENL
jgi:general secretion pathway protein D